MGVKTGAKILACGDEVGEQGVLGIADKTWLTGEWDEMAERRKRGEMAKVGLQWMVRLELLGRWI